MKFLDGNELTQLFFGLLSKIDRRLFFRGLQNKKKIGDNQEEKEPEVIKLDPII